MNRGLSFPDATSLTGWSSVVAPSLIVYLAAVWLMGGVPLDNSTADEWLQLLALPLILIAIAVHATDIPLSRLTRAGMIIAVLVTAVPALQLLAVPDALWQHPIARQALASDLHQAGVSVFPHRWTLTPSGTEQAFWALMPALAGFLASLGVPATSRRRIVQAIVIIVLANVMFAFFQVGLPLGSPLRLYPDFDAGFGGLLVNTNHQATALIIGMVLAVGLSVDAKRCAAAGGTSMHAPWWYGGLAGVFLLLVPLSTSRAGMAIALLALAAALLLTGALQSSRIRWSKRGPALAVVIALLVIIGAWSAYGWIQVDKIEEIRHTLTAAAMTMADAQAPLGSGAGSLIPVFEQQAPPSLWLAHYVNHVHNEYAQWWLTGGWLAMLALCATLSLLAVAMLRIIRLHAKSGMAIMAAACFVSVGVALAHSWADYPLQTTALNTTVAVVAGLLLASLADARAHARIMRAPRQSDGDTAHAA